MESILLLFSITTFTAIFVILLNSLVALKHNNDRAWGRIKASLLERDTILDPLLDICQEKMDSDQALINTTRKLRSELYTAVTCKNNAKLSEIEYTLREYIDEIFEALDDYDELYNDRNLHKQFTLIQKQQTSLDKSYQRYNDNIQHYNNHISRFPTAFVARLLLLRKLAAIAPEQTDKQQNLGVLLTGY